MKAARKNNHPQCTTSSHRCQAVLKGEITVIKVQATPAGGEEIEVVCELDGSLEELAHETVAIINGIYNGIAEDSENVFELAVFQAAIMEAVGDHNSSVWDRRKGVEM